jgi:hypothetical protein
MTERAYITVDRGLLGVTGIPRLFEVAAPGSGGSDILVLQDLHDTANSNTLPAGDPDDSLDNMDDDFLLDSGGKQSLGGGREVGITTTLHNSQIAFEGNYTPQQTGTATSTDAPGTTLTDLSAQFQTNLVERGAVLINYTDRSVTEVLKVVSETVLIHRVLKNGIANDWTIGDAYDIFNVIQKQVNDGNLSAVLDDAPFPTGSELNPIFPTFATQVVVARDVSAALIPGQSGLQPGDTDDIADAVLDENVLEHLTAGSLGRYISDIFDAGILAATTVSVGSTASVILTPLTEADNFYNGLRCMVIGAKRGDREIDLYLNSGGRFNLVEALPFTPVPGDVVLILSRHIARVGGV